MKKIGDIFASTKKKNGIKVIAKGIDEKTVLFLAERIILSQYGIRGRENIIPKAFKGKKLFFLCRSSLWMNEVWINRDLVVKKMNQELGNEFITDIKVTGMF